MPTGTRKTVTLLSLITSCQLAHPEVGKLIHCTRTSRRWRRCGALVEGRGQGEGQEASAELGWGHDRNALASCLAAGCCPAAAAAAAGAG